MNRITNGKTYKADDFRAGCTEKGKNWEMLTVLDENGKNGISVFPINVPCGIEKGDEFLVESIESISSGFRKGSDEKWYATTSVNAVVSAAAV